MLVMPSATSTTCQHMENEPYVSSTQTFPYRLPKSCSPISWNTCIHTVQSKKRASNLVNLNPSLLEGENDAKRRCFIFCKTCNSGAGDFGSLALALSLSLSLSLSVSLPLSLFLSPSPLRLWLYASQSDENVFTFCRCLHVAEATEPSSLPPPCEHSCPRS